jgi:hypothetical protein
MNYKLLLGVKIKINFKNKETKIPKYFLKKEKKWKVIPKIILRCKRNTAQNKNKHSSQKLLRLVFFRSKEVIRDLVEHEFKILTT